MSAERVREKIGQVVTQDTVFCAIENPAESRVEIAISEEDVPLIRPGLPVRLKARAIPLESFDAVVDSIASVVRSPESGGSMVVVHCLIDNPDGRLKSGMTGFGRIYRGSNSAGMILASKAIKYVRTEFWW